MPIALALTFLVFGILHACFFWMGSELVPLLGALCFSAAGGSILLSKWWDVWREGIFVEVVSVLLLGLAAVATSQTRFANAIAPAGFSTPVITIVAIGFGGVMALLLMPDVLKALKRLSAE